MLGLVVLLAPKQLIRLLRRSKLVTSLIFFLSFLFTVAGKPKKPNALKTICLMLGPDFITDIIEVGTLGNR